MKWKNRIPDLPHKRIFAVSLVVLTSTLGCNNSHSNQNKSARSVEGNVYNSAIRVEWQNERLATSGLTITEVTNQVNVFFDENAEFELSDLTNLQIKGNQKKWKLSDLAKIHVVFEKSK